MSRAERDAILKELSRLAADLRHAAVAGATGSYAADLFREKARVVDRISDLVRRVD